MRGRVAVLAAVAVVASGVAVVEQFFAILSFVYGPCGYSDTASTRPADASLQGQVCSTEGGDTWLSDLGFAAFVVGGIGMVVLCVLYFALADGPWKVVCVVPFLVVPPLILLLLTAPSDTCTASERRHMAYADACSTRPG